ncbi:MAG: hypothetical protein GAK28_00154 [Luteibacter sp.]|uniref:hypothetical protein n=1 Tax=Luteibacter sp. TaxID=1886636 RepID=UPI0013846DF0|nr:hypothetical protein [Luteibacter sp.]KAF1009516.1 MAG: hypothetical protein GAK28_00154 [Luteibacter sp.]
MSRARNIKPGFFKNDVLAECDPLARILFAALWCEADRAGRLEDRPKKIKAECLPYDECDIEALLGQLSANGFILRYEVGGLRFIQILAFGKHQNPHKNEAPSSIPAPELHRTSTVQVASPDGSPPADSSLLIPDSLNLDSLSSDSLNPEERDTSAHTCATDAGEAALAMRRAGCISINQSLPDFIEALAEGVTLKEFEDAVIAHKAKVQNSGLFAYAVKAARTNHQRKAEVLELPGNRGHPARSAPSRQQQLEDRNQRAVDQWLANG